MSGWCPRCDAVRAADGTCPECQASLIDLDERPIRPAAEREEGGTEVTSVAAQPPRGRLRVAVAVAAVVLVGLAFVAGRSTGGASARTVPRSTSAITTTSAPATAELQRQLGWRGKPSKGIGVEAVSITRIPTDTVNGDASTGDNFGTLTLRVDGLEPGRQLLGVTGLRLIDSGGGVFAEPDSLPVGGVPAVPVQTTGQADRYQVGLGPTPSVDTLDRIEFEDLLVSAPVGDRGRVELPSGGAWPARAPLRAVEPAAGSVSVPVARADGGSGNLPLRVDGAFVGAGRAVVVLSFPAREAVPGGDVGDFPVTANVRAGQRQVCSRLTVIRAEEAQVSPLLVIDCPTSPAPLLTVELAAGVEALRFGASLSA
jgi:hypothetical protein